MPRIYPLFSSSSGNCTYIGNKSEGVLVDCGVSYSRIKNALADWDIELQSAVRAVLITHSHSDHISGLKILSKKIGAPVFAEPDTLAALLDEGLISGEYKQICGAVSLDCCTAEPFPTSHDTNQSCGFRFSFPDKSSCAVCTDLGIVTDTVRNMLSGCKAVLIESNYDEEMLAQCSYPDFLKERIRSRTGHLSNSDCARLCAELIPLGTKKFILGHISKDSNSPQRAVEVNRRILSELGFEPNRDYIMTAALPSDNHAFTAF